MDPDTMLPIGERHELILSRRTRWAMSAAARTEMSRPRRQAGVSGTEAFVNPVTGELQLPQALPAGGGFNREKLVKMFRSIGKPTVEALYDKA